METIVLVRVVPILAPMTTGIAFSNVIVPAATAATAIEVVVELLCRMAVPRRPMNSPIAGFPKAISKFCEKSDPIDWKLIPRK